MALRVEIIDGQGSGIAAGVSPTGEVLVAGEGTLTNTSQFQTMNVINTAFNFFGPIPGQQFIITSIAFDGNAGSTVTVYEAADATSTTIDRILFKMNLRAAGQIAIPFSFGGFIAVDEGEYLNVQTDTQPVNMNISGYYHAIENNPL